MFVGGMISNSIAGIQPRRRLRREALLLRRNLRRFRAVGRGIVVA